MADDCCAFLCCCCCVFEGLTCFSWPGACGCCRTKYKDDESVEIDERALEAVMFQQQPHATPMPQMSQAPARLENEKTAQMIRQDDEMPRYHFASGS